MKFLDALFGRKRGQGIEDGKPALVEAIHEVVTDAPLLPRGPESQGDPSLRLKNGCAQDDAITSALWVML
jgi:hypothetical protein